MFIKLNENYCNGRTTQIMVNVDQITYVEQLRDGAVQIWFQALDCETRDGVRVIEPYEDVCNAILFAQRKK